MKKKTIYMADLFCGAGGSSTGVMRAARAAGKEVQLTAINHWDLAVQTHATNHPDARHFCVSLTDLNPRTLFKPGQLDLLWGSPECTNHSRARGGIPVHDQSRATAWCVTRWAEALQPKVIFVENVAEFVRWGPLGRDGLPIKSKEGQVFVAWVNALESLGYRVDWRVLNAADYGAAQSRERLIVQAVRGRHPLRWPEPTHASRKQLAAWRKAGDPRADQLKPWEPARSIVDWSLEGRWLDEMPGRERYGGLPLSPKTMRRIYAGLQRYGLNPCLVPHFGERPTQQPRTHSLDHPLPAVTGQGAGSLVQPYLVLMRGTNDRQLQSSNADMETPLSTITAGGSHHALVQPYLVPTAHGGGDDRSRGLGEPLGTVCGQRGDMALIEPHLLPQHSCGALRPVSEPSSTITCSGAIALVQPYLVKYFGTANGSSLEEPLGTLTTKDRYALVCPEVHVNGERARIRMRWRMLQPHELARGQSFPEGYQFVGNKTQVVKQIGNAVPPELAHALAACHFAA